MFEKVNMCFHGNLVKNASLRLRPYISLIGNHESAATNSNKEYASRDHFA